MGIPTALETVPSAATIPAATATAGSRCRCSSTSHDMVSCLQVCRSWRDVASSEQLWQQQCLDLEPHPHLRRDDLLPGEWRRWLRVCRCLGCVLLPILDQRIIVWWFQAVMHCLPHPVLRTLMSRRVWRQPSEVLCLEVAHAAAPAWKDSGGGKPCW
jgi:hypothetical protein